MRTVRCAVTVLLVLGAVACPMDAWSLSGTGWTEMPEAQRGAYVVGLVDSWFSLKEGLPTDYAEAKQCLERQQMPYGRIVSQVDAYMRSHQADWPKDMGALTLAALQTACPK